VRILAIRGENLASLAQLFDIDFEREPLRSAGLFAITGETGAGKSTILDALCLALYDKFPRVLAAGATEGAPDPSGQTLGANDPRVILRRGAGRGFAEADFIARDGLRYRARCELARARGGAAGRLQNRGRSLWRIDESGERIETLESGVEPVNARIVELTDLTFDQFRRTALLAQGDFDAFLRANANERGDLLEKITGAEIYSRISIRAFEKAREAREAVELLEGRRREIGGLSEEDRAALVAEARTLDAQRATLATERAAIVASLRQIDAQALAKGKLLESQAVHAAAGQAFAALAERRATLDALTRVEPLRAARQEALRAEASRLDNEKALVLATERVVTARQSLEAAQAQERLAAEAFSVRKDEVARFAPVWSQASALDTRLAGEAQEVDKARDDAARARRRAEEEGAALAEARAQEAAATAAGDAARKNLERLAAARPLAERWAEIDDWLDKRAGFVAERKSESDLLRKAEEAVSQARDRRRALDEADAADRLALGEALEQIGERDKALAALDAPAAEARLEALTRSQELLREMARAARAHAAATETATRATSDIAQYGDAAAALATQLAALEEARAKQSVETDDAERFGELAEAAAGREALRLRVALQEGEACPVCGAHDHPFAHVSGAAQELVETLRARRDAARAAMKAINDEVARASAGSAQALARRDEAQRQRQDAQGAMQGAAADYAAALAKASAIDAPAEVVGALGGLELLIVDCEERREAGKKLLASAQALARDVSQLRKVADQKAAAIEARRKEVGEIETATREAGEARVRAEQSLKGAIERISSLDRSLGPFLTLADLSPADLDRDPMGAKTRLEATGKTYAQAAASLAEAERRRVALAQEIAGLTARAEAAAEQAAVAAETHAVRREALSALQEERAALLGGEATVPHRVRIEAAQEAARQAHETARGAFADANTQQAVCVEGEALAARELETAQRAEATACTAFDAALVAAGVDAQAAIPLLDLPALEVKALREEVETAREALKGAEAAFAARRNDLAEVEAAGVPETPREELAAREAALAQEIDAALTRLGVLRQQIEQDDAARRRSSDLSVEIDAAGATRRLWDDINAAIGSREGDRFRRFAQSVTLEQLVALANQRLALLAPRYQLERGGEVASLSLQIVDRDLGDERRSTRSLSGGERFLASLALALALAGLEGRDSFVDTLFIDEGFGALDSATLDVAIDALETLQGQGRKVGVISHVDQLQSRIATKICVERRGGGLSVVRLRAPGVEL
jgi:DNA repair protein SbcC/Rad50